MRALIIILLIVVWPSGKLSAQEELVYIWLEEGTLLCPRIGTCMIVREAGHERMPCITDGETGARYLGPTLRWMPVEQVIDGVIVKLPYNHNKELYLQEKTPCPRTNLI